MQVPSIPALVGVAILIRLIFFNLQEYELLRIDIDEVTRSGISMFITQNFDVPAMAPREPCQYIGSRSWPFRESPALLPWSPNIDPGQPIPQSRPPERPKLTTDPLSQVSVTRLHVLPQPIARNT